MAPPHCEIGEGFLFCRQECGALLCKCKLWGGTCVHPYPAEPRASGPDPTGPLQNGVYYLMPAWSAQLMAKDEAIAEVLEIVASEGVAIPLGLQRGMIAKKGGELMLVYSAVASLDSQDNLSVTATAEPHPDLPDPDFQSAYLEVRNEGAKGKVVLVKKSGTHTASW